MNKIFTCGQLLIEFPESIMKIEKLQIIEELNEHGLAIASLTVLSKKEYRFIDELSQRTILKIFLDKKCIFCGVLSSIVTKKTGQVYYVKLNIKSTTFLLDIKPVRRSFQNKQNSFQNLFHTVVTSEMPEAVVFDYASNDCIQEEPVIQYNETNWQFLLRMASKLKSKVIVNVKSEIPHISVGTFPGEVYEEPTHSFEIVRENDVFLKSELNYGGWKEEDTIYFKLKSTNQYELSDTMIYENITLKIAKKETFIEKGLVLFIYYIVKENGLQALPLVNHSILGVSIAGKVIAVKNDRVKVHLCIDKEQSVEEAYWYPVETNYTSEGQTGFYCMPQIGDEVNLYIPNEYMENAYVRILNRLDGKSNLKTQNPDVKYLGNIHKKELMLAPAQLQLTAKNGMILLNMDEREGIELTSSADIHICTQSSAKIQGKKIGIWAMNEIRLATRHSGISLKENINIKADGGVNL
ncbi:MAG TPA: hypothetical protein IAB62_00780 [Candidatus Coprocola pullicola]|nr:hypothetical protein [Candidatus Coprocola pullicola]